MSEKHSCTLAKCKLWLYLSQSLIAQQLLAKTTWSAAAAISRLHSALAVKPDVLQKKSHVIEDEPYLLHVSGLGIWNKLKNLNTHQKSFLIECLLSH